MRILFLGTGELGVPALEAMVGAGYEVVGVVVQPDRPRGKERRHPVKVLAQSLGLEVYQPADINSEESLLWCSGLEPDLIVLAAYGQILRKRILGLPRLGCLNIHASLLPKYRGASPVHYAILNGEKRTGITVQRMVRRLDAGPVLLQEELEIWPDETMDRLYWRLAQLGAKGILRALRLLELGRAEFSPQDHSEATYAPVLSRRDGLVDWSRPVEELYCFIRAMTSWPGAFSYLHREGKRPLRVIFSRVEPALGRGRPGEVIYVDGENLKVAAGRGALWVRELVPEARKRLQVRDFLNGYRVRKGDIFLGHG